jgi:hypothetical protein
MSQYGQMTTMTDSLEIPHPAAENVQFSFMQTLLKAAEAPGIRKIQRTRLRLLASIAKQLSDGAEQADLRVADVVAAAGLAHGTFYRYFPICAQPSKPSSATSRFLSTSNWPIQEQASADHETVSGMPP